MSESAKPERDELAIVREFHAFLQGVLPEGVTTEKFRKMNPKQAFTVIWFLQEVSRVVDDRFELCANCNEVFDSYREGHYDEKRGKHYCGGCP